MPDVAFSFPAPQRYGASRLPGLPFKSSRIASFAGHDVRPALVENEAIFRSVQDAKFGKPAPRP